MNFLGKINVLENEIGYLNTLVALLDPPELTIDQHLGILEVVAYRSCLFIDIIMSMYPIETILRNADKALKGDISFRPAWLQDMDIFEESNKYPEDD